MGNLGVNKALLSNNLLCRHKPIIVSLSPDSNSTQIFSKYFPATGRISGHLLIDVCDNIINVGMTSKIRQRRIYTKFTNIY